MYIEIALKLVFGYIGLLIVTRLVGKKEMAQLTPFDFVFAVVFGGIVEQGVYAKEISNMQVLFAIAVWGGLEYFTETVNGRYKWIRKPVNGRASILIEDGEINIDEMAKNNIEMEQLRMMLRQQGIFTLREVRYAYLETSGSISVMKYGNASPVTPDVLQIGTIDPVPSVLLIDEGEIEKGSLRKIERDETWLMTELHKLGIGKIETVYYAEWSEQEGLYVKKYDKIEKMKSKKGSSFTWQKGRK